MAEGSLPFVSLVIAVYNEEDILEEKLKNCLEIDYPTEKLEILIGSDASDDRTSEILKKYVSHPQIKIFEYPERRGKAGVLNRLVKEAQGEMLIFCDANTMLLKNAVKKIAGGFGDPKTGAICGRLILKDARKVSLSEGESLYWKIESEIKNLEGKLGIVMGANGGLYGLRKSLYRTLPEQKTVMDDFYITTDVLKKGFRVLYDTLAIGTEETSLDTFGEFNRKIRIGEANFNHLPTFISLLNPLRPLVALSFFSHKLLRWFSPLLLILIGISNILAVFLHPHSITYSVILLMQICGYALGYLGYRRALRHKSSGFVLAAPFYFLTMNTALFLGLLKSIFGKKQGSWERIQRGPTS